MAGKHFGEIEGMFDKAAEIPAAARAAALVDLGPERSGIALQQEAEASPDDPFDYDALTLSNDERFVLKGCRQRIVATLGAAFISAGKELLDAKQLIQEKCPRGTWSKWLKGSLSVSESTARNWMDSASWAAECPTVGVMAPGALYLGAAAPTEVQAQIVKRLEGGEPVKAIDIKQMIAAHRAADPETVTGDAEGDSTNENADAHLSNESDVVPDAERLEPESVARELLARLREQFDDLIIAEIFELIDRTSIEILRKVLVEGQRSA